MSEQDRIDEMSIADMVRDAESGVRRIQYEWRNKPERCSVGGKVCSFRSQIERKWATYLQLLKDVDGIEDWSYESRTFEFKERYRRRIQYTPDFRVVELNDDGKRYVVWHEVKTSVRQTDVRRFKYMAADYPDEIMVLVVPYDSRKTKQIINRENASKYVARTVLAGPLFRKYGIR